uniref:Uncharacterized protein n=1 Tax=Fagus sylvatica TaxID=28930 RepID=A0A2N9HAL9_FAGSY
MGKKRAEEDKGKLARYVNTPENMALFRRLYRVPDDVGLRYVHWSDALPPSAGELLIPVVAVVEGGVRFPIDPLLADFLSYFSLSPTQVNPNIFRIVMGTVELNRRLGLELSTYDIVWTYILHRNSKTESYSLRPRDINYTLVNGLPDTNRGFDDDYLVVTGEWFLPGRRFLGGENPARTWLRSTAYAKSGSASTARTIGHNPAPPQSSFANPENDALPAVDIRDVIDGTAPDMTGINLRNLLPTRRDEGTSVGAPSSSRPASRKRGRTEGTAGPSRPTVDPLPSSSVPEPPSTDQQVTQLGNVIRAGMVLRSGSQVRGDRSAPLWAPTMEYRGEGAVTEEDSILPVDDGRSGSVASALSQAVRLPLDMGEWKKTPDEELINNMRRGALMGVQASLELEERFRTTKEHLAHANVLALRYQDARNAAAEAKRLAEEADSKRKEAEESLTAALDSLTKAQDRIQALESEFDQAKKASYEAGNNDAQAEMGEQLPGVCNEFFSDGWKKAVSFLSSGQTTLPPLPPSVPFPGARPPPPPEVVLATPLDVPVTPITELSTDIVNLEDEESPAEGAVPEDAVLEDAVPEDAAQAPSAGEGGGAVPDEAGPDAQ